MKMLSVMIKPASSLCNLRCRYCFYADISENREIASNGIMTDETMDALIRRISEELSGKGTANISFQGGEPTAAGLDYFKKFTEKMKQYPDIKVNYALQTNGTLITEEWAQFFAENHFLLGVSIDGYKLNMDQFRFDAKGNSVFDRIMDSVKLLRKYKVDFNILTVVTNDLAKHSKALYRFFRDNHFDYVQLIPCLPGFHESTDIFALTPDEYAGFYNTFFDEWLKDVKKGKPELWLKFLTQIDEETDNVEQEMLENEEIYQALQLVRESAFTPGEREAYKEYWLNVSTEKTALEESRKEGREEGEGAEGEGAEDGRGEEEETEGEAGGGGKEQNGIMEGRNAKEETCQVSKGACKS